MWDHHLSSQYVVRRLYPISGRSLNWCVLSDLLLRTSLSLERVLIFSPARPPRDFGYVGKIVKETTTGPIPTLSFVGDLPWESRYVGGRGVETGSVGWGRGPDLRPLVTFSSWSGEVLGIRGKDVEGKT